MEKRINSTKFILVFCIICVFCFDLALANIKPIDINKNLGKFPKEKISVAKNEFKTKTYIKVHKEKDITSTNRSSSFIKTHEISNHIYNKKVIANKDNNLVITSFSSDNKNYSSVVSQLTTLLKSNPLVSVKVQDLSNGKLIYQKNPESLFLPASTQKLFTAAASLFFLRPDYRFSTRIYALGKVQNHVLIGDLILKFYGDPVLHKEDLWNLLSKVKESGISSIQGKVIVDDSAYDHDYYAPGWMWDELNFCYAAPISSLIIDKNCLHLVWNPLDRTLKKYPTYTIQNNVGYSNGAKNTSCDSLLRISSQNTYYFHGCTLTNNKSIALSAAIRNPLLYGSKQIADYLQRLGINYNSIFNSFVDVNNARLLAEHQSTTTSELVKYMLKHSDNVIANSLYKQMGFVYNHNTATWHNSYIAINNILNKFAQIEINKIKLLDGAGLSRYNLVSAEQISRLLDKVYHSTIKDYFINSLPISGIDGTLAHRLGAKATINVIHAKTGTMSGISSLAGYLIKPGRTWSFVIMNNGFVSNHFHAHQLEEEICRILSS